MENQVFIRKASGDYEIDGKLRSGKFWEIKVEDIVIRKPGSYSRQRIVEIAQENFGFDAVVYERVS